ncbi:MAG: type II toxin-antitoxin system HicA family toxin [Propionicimonas sp.]
MKYRELAGLLRWAGFTPQPGRGDHDKWVAARGRHVTVRQQQEASPGVVGQVLQAIEEEEG